MNTDTQIQLPIQIQIQNAYLDIRGAPTKQMIHHSCKYWIINTTANNFITFNQRFTFTFSTYLLECLYWPHFLQVLPIDMNVWICDGDIPLIICCTAINTLHPVCTFPPLIFPLLMNGVPGKAARIVIDNILGERFLNTMLEENNLCFFVFCICIV